MSEDSLKGYDHDAAPSAEDRYICRHCGGAIQPNGSDCLDVRRIHPYTYVVDPANEAELDRKMLAARKKALEDAAD